MSLLKGEMEAANLANGRIQKGRRMMKHFKMGMTMIIEEDEFLNYPLLHFIALIIDIPPFIAFHCVDN